MKKQETDKTGKLTGKIVAHDEGSAAIPELTYSIRRSGLVGRRNIDAGDVDVETEIERVVSCLCGEIEGRGQHRYRHVRHACIAEPGMHLGRGVPLVGLCDETGKSIDDVTLATILVAFRHNQSVKRIPVPMRFVPFVQLVRGYCRER